MYPDKYRLGFLSRYLLAALERKLPAYRAWTATAELDLRALVDEELLQARRQFTELADDPAHFDRIERAVREILLPRYFAAAKEEVALAARDYGVWRGGDLVARGTFAGAGLLLGLIAVWLPNWLVPIETYAFPVALFAIGPFIPDLQVWIAKRRHARRLERIARDMEDAEQHLDVYRPLVALAEPAPHERLPDEHAARPISPREKTH